MAVSFRKALLNVFADKSFLPKYTVLVILSFCSGLFYFAVLAKNTPYILPTFILAFAASILAVGYDLCYINGLLQNENSELPNWTNLLDISVKGLKFCIAVMLIVSAIFALFLIAFSGCSLLSVFVSKLIAIVILCGLLFFLLLLELFLFISLPGFIFCFLDNDSDIFSFFKFKKAISYYSVNYFSAVSVSFLMLSINGLLATITTINIRYVLLYIIPLMLAPFIRLIVDNLLSQAYIANKNGQTSLFAQMTICLLLSLIIFALIILISVKMSTTAF